MTYQDVLDAALSLSLADQVRLAETLMEKVSPAEWPLPSGEWIAEAQRRSREFDEGREVASSWSDVRERARKKAGLDG